MKTIEVSEKEYEDLGRTRNVEAGFDKLTRILKGIFVLMFSILLLIFAGIMLWIFLDWWFTVVV